MTPEKQQIALCEWMGWRWDTIIDGRLYNTIPQRGSPDDELEELPNTNSLDVLHEMVLKIKDTHQYSYCGHLIEVVCGKGHGYGPDGEIEGDDFLVFNASVSQVREALLRTIGKWEE